MMNFSGWGMMGGAGFLFTIFWIVIFVDAILLGIWLWQQITKK